VIFVQFQGVADKNIDQFRSAGKQVIVAPDAYKTGQVRSFSESRN
jgi:branched-chain amino acid transport system substrate-binding protein